MQTIVVTDPNDIMVTRRSLSFVLFSLLVIMTSLSVTKSAQAQLFDILPEQKRLHIRSPEQLSPAMIPQTGIPFTIANKSETRDVQRISLDEAIQIAIANAEAIRVLGGVSAAASGRTIYDVAISNTQIDIQNAVFDPTFDISSTMGKTDRPSARFDPLDPNRSIFAGSSTDSINTTASLSKRMFNGGTASMNANAIGSYFEPGVFPLEPEYRSFVELALRQPLMRGYGRDANLAPVVVARIDTERSYFQFKDSVQELVRSVIASYWNLVAARVDVWARQQQVEQAEFAYKRAIARKEEELIAVADLAQSRSALANFKANLIGARSTLLLSETAMRNVLGLEPSNTSVLVPTSMPVLEQVDFDWEEIVRMAEMYRPDIIELKLVLEADCHSLKQADNQAKPQLDGIANYRWDGLSGEMPNGDRLGNDPGRFAGFNLGVSFSVPLGLRQGRASLRRQELLIARDRVNLDQGIHQMVHQLTINYRNLDQFFEQYIAFKEAREAARLNYENQIQDFLAGRREFINVLQAITDWGNAVSQEARSITQYNSELANIERQTGTILETHGVTFVEERFGSLGPRLLGIRRSSDDYQGRIGLAGSTDKYSESDDTSDDAFNLEDLDYERESIRPDDMDIQGEIDSVPAIESPRPNSDAELSNEVSSLPFEPPAVVANESFQANKFGLIKPAIRPAVTQPASSSNTSPRTSKRVFDLFRRR